MEIVSSSPQEYRIWNPEFECLPVEAIHALQLMRLIKTVERVEKQVPFYKERLQKAGVSSTSIKSLDDIRRIPFTTKEDLRDHYPYGLLATPFKDVVRIHASSGTTGKPTVVPYSRKEFGYLV